LYFVAITVFYRHLYIIEKLAGAIIERLIASKLCLTSAAVSDIVRIEGVKIYLSWFLRLFSVFLEIKTGAGKQCA